MSMQTDNIYGIGFQIKIEPDQLQKFLQNHKESIEKNQRCRKHPRMPRLR